MHCIVWKCIVWGWDSTAYTSDCSVTAQNCNSTLLQRTRFPHYCIGSEVQSQRVSETLTSTVALQHAQSAQETMICSCWYCVYTINPHCIALKYTYFITAHCCQSKKLERSSNYKGRSTYDLIILSSLHTTYLNAKKIIKRTKKSFQILICSEMLLRWF